MRRIIYRIRSSLSTRLAHTQAKTIGELLYVMLRAKPDLFYQPSLDKRQGDISTGWLTALALVLRMQAFVEEANVTYTGTSLSALTTAAKQLGVFLGKADSEGWRIGARARASPGDARAQDTRLLCSQARASKRWTIL